MFSGDKRRTDLSDYTDASFFRFSVFLFRALSLTREQVRERSRVRERPGASLDLCRVTAFVSILKRKIKMKIKISTSSRTRAPFLLSFFSRWLHLFSNDTMSHKKLEKDFDKCCCFIRPELTSFLCRYLPVHGAGSHNMLLIFPTFLDDYFWQVIIIIIFFFLSTEHPSGPAKRVTCMVTPCIYCEMIKLSHSKNTYKKKIRLDE